MMKFLRTLRFSALLAAILTPFPCALLSGSKYFELATIPSVWIGLTVLVLILKLVTDALAAARRKLSRPAPEDIPAAPPSTFLEEVTELIYVGDYFTLAIGLFPAVVVYFVLLLVEYRGVADRFILVASLGATALWLWWLEKRSHATIRLPLVPVKLYYPVLVGFVLAILSGVWDVLFS